MIYDLDNNGYISNGDLYNSIKMFVGDNLTEIQIQQLVDRTIIQADKDKDGMLSFEEFQEYVKSMKIQEMFSMDLFNLEKDKENK